MTCDEFRQQCRERAATAADATLNADWELHLLSCARCADFFNASCEAALSDAELGHARDNVLAATLGARNAVDDLLFGIREVSPPPELLAGVLSRTTERKTLLRPTRRAHSRWESLLLSFMQRPRIALEASFLITCALVMTFGVPADVVSNAASAEARLQKPIANSRQTLAALHQEVAVLLKGDSASTRQGERP